MTYYGITWKCIAGYPYHDIANKASISITKSKLFCSSSDYIPNLPLWIISSSVAFLGTPCWSDRADNVLIRHLSRYINPTPRYLLFSIDSAAQYILAPGIDGSRFLPVLGNSIRNWWSRTLCNLTREGPLVRFICEVTSENLMVHYFTLMLELKFTEFVILKDKYNC